MRSACGSLGGSPTLAGQDGLEPQPLDRAGTRPMLPIGIRRAPALRGSAQVQLVARLSTPQARLFRGGAGSPER